MNAKEVWKKVVMKLLLRIELQIAKNMERWAEGVNKSRANQQKELQLWIQQEREEKER